MNQQKEVYRRRRFYIDKRFQTRFILKFCSILIIGCAVLGIALYLLSLRSTTVAIENSKVLVKRTADFIMPLLIGSSIVAAILMAIVAVFITLFTSHKISGPLFRFRKVMAQAGSGDLSFHLSFRKNDQLQDVAKGFDEMIGKMRQAVLSIKQKWLELKPLLKEVESVTDSEDKRRIFKQLDERISQLEQKLDYFKV